MIRKIYNEFTSANILAVTVEHNGYQGGDAGHGGYVKIIFEDLASTAMECSVIPELWMENENFRDKIQNEKSKIELIFRGSTERDTLLAGLKMIVKELEEHPSLNDETGILYRNRIPIIRKW